MTTRSPAIEYWGKGLAMALIAFVALETCLNDAQPDPWRLAIVYLPALAGLLAFMSVAAVGMFRAGHRVGGRVPAFVVFLLLDNPFRVYLGILGGLVLGVLAVVYLAQWPWLHLPMAIVAGLAIGEAFSFLQRVANRWIRGGTVLVLLAGLAAGFLFWVKVQPELLTTAQQDFLVIHLLLAIPVLYLLTLAGRTEETEVEIGCVCIALGLALTLVLPASVQALGVVLAIAIYVLYVQRVLRHLQVFKYVLRGMTYLETGRHRAALLAYRRALQLKPDDRLAQEGQWLVHKRLDFNKAADDPQMMQLIDLDLCLQRVAALLVEPRPGGDKLQEARKLLDLVARQRPAAWPVVRYWQAVALLHEGELDRAEATLRLVLTPAADASEEAQRQTVLLAAWQLALAQHPQLSKRLRDQLLDVEGRRLEAIAAVERRLRDAAEDAAAWELKRLLYPGLTEEVVARGVAAASPTDGVPATLPDFDGEYCVQLGRELLADAVHWRRGAEFLRMAAIVMPLRAPVLWGQIGEACERVGDEANARRHFDRMRQAARALGVKQLADEDQATFFATVKRLAEKANAVGDVDLAIENWSLYAECGASGQETLRLLTDLHEKRGNALGALQCNERVLLYDPGDKELQERRDRYYYSVMPRELAGRVEQVKSLFDVGYCVRKAKALLDLRQGGAEQLDWAAHLVELARTVEPKNLQAKTLAGRILLKRGQPQDAVALFAEVRQAKEAGFANADEEEAWYVASRLLGDLYLQECNRPDLALACFSDYRKHSKSGVDTLYKMGLAFEQLGERAKAVKCYQNVVAYDHPLASEARAALYRLEATVP
jgi:tetratricopeptide (TPR) repeat protein